VEALGTGRHEPPPPRVREALLQRAIPFIQDPDAPPEEKILAVRDMGSAGYLLGADALIPLLAEDDAELRRTAAWALEAISGVPAGEDVGRWQEWWQNLPATPVPLKPGQP
jgi:hypothetical protein